MDDTTIEHIAAKISGLASVRNVAGKFKSNPCDETADEYWTLLKIFVTVATTLHSRASGEETGDDDYTRIQQATVENLDREIPGLITTMGKLANIPTAHGKH